MSHVNTRENLKRRLNAVFQDVFNDETIEIFDEMTADDVEGWDSLKHITLIVATEREFGMKFHTFEVGELENVSAMLDLLEERATV